MASIGKEVTIGVDPHPGSHTGCALDVEGRELGRMTVANNDEGVKELRRWGQTFPCRRWAVEGAGNHFAAALVAFFLGAWFQLLAPEERAMLQSRLRVVGIVFSGNRG